MFYASFGIVMAAGIPLARLLTIKKGLFNMITEKTVKPTLPVWQLVIAAIVGQNKAENTNRSAASELSIAYRNTGLDGPEYAALNLKIVDGLAKRMKWDPKEAFRRANPILRTAKLIVKADLDPFAKKGDNYVLPSIFELQQAAFLKMPELKTKRGKPAGSKNKKTVAKATAVANKVAGETAAAVNSAADRFNSSAERERFYNTLTPEALALDFKVMWTLMAKVNRPALMALIKAK